jgi:hypothetical protein
VGFVRFSKIAVLVSAVALVLGVVVSPVGAQRKPSIEENTEQLQKCVQSNGSLDILFLVDVSASLYRMDNKPGSDPDGLRVQALQAVTRLLGVTEGLDETNVATKKPIHDVNLAFLDFGERVRYSFQNKELQGWQSLSRFLKYDFEDDIFRRFKTARGDSDTDYVRALDPTSLKSKKVSQNEVGALQVLKKGKSPCRVLLWFTDGKFDIDKSSHSVPWIAKGAVSGITEVRDAIPSGKDYLCKRDPRYGEALVDVLRNLRDNPASPPVFIGAIGLGKKVEDFELLKGIAEGDNGCGDAPAFGKFVAATNPQDLLDALRQILVPTDLTNPTECGVAPSGSSSFRIGQALQRMSLLVTARTSGADVSIVGPDTSTQRISLVRNGVVQQSGSTLGIDASVKQLFSVGDSRNKVTYLLVSAEMNPDIPGWSGIWGVEFCNKDLVGTGNRVYVYASGDLEIIAPNPVLTAERTKEISLQLVGRGAKSYSDPSGFLNLDSRTVKVDGEEVDPASLAFSSDGQLTIPYSPTNAQIGDEVVVEVSIEPRFDLGNGELIPVAFETWTNSFQIRKVPNKPSLEVKGAWGTLTKANNTTEIQLRIHAGEEDGKLCINGISDVQVPKGSPDSGENGPQIALSGKSIIDCYAVTKNQPDLTLPLTVKAPNKFFEIEANGNLTFNVDWSSSTLTEPNTDESLLQQIMVVSSGTTSINWIQLLVFVLFAILIPLLILYGFNYFYGAKLVVAPYYYVSELRRDGLKILENVNGSFGAVAPYDPNQRKKFDAGMGGSRTRSVTAQSLVVRGVVPLNPFGEASSAAVVPNGLTVGSRGSSGLAKYGSAASEEVSGLGPLVLSGTWFIALDGTTCTEERSDFQLFVFGEDHRDIRRNRDEVLSEAFNLIEPIEDAVRIRRQQEIETEIETKTTDSVFPGPEELSRPKPVGFDIESVNQPPPAGSERVSRRGFRVNRGKASPVEDSGIPFSAGPSSLNSESKPPEPPPAV